MARLEVEVDGAWLRSSWDRLRRAFKEKYGDIMAEEDSEGLEGRERLLIEAEARLDEVALDGGDLLIYAAVDELGDLFVSIRIPVNLVLAALLREMSAG